MNIKNGTLRGLKEDILQQNSKIVIFGTGVIGVTVASAILCELNLDERLAFYLDNDSTKWSTGMYLSGRYVPVVSPDILADMNGQVTIFLAISRYAEALDQLRTMKCTEKMSVYIVPMLCITNYCGRNDDYIRLIKSEKMLIPKIIHYMWLGGEKMPKVLLRCIESWKKYCPDYEIICWDESNYDVHKNTFISEAYDKGKYGFVPDYARLDILYEYGGIYMDTDVEVLRNLDDMLYQDAFCGVEKWQVLNFGSCSGSVKGHKSLETFLERWENRKLIRNDGTLDTISSGLIDTSIALENGYKISGICQNVLGMNVYSNEFFSPYDYMTGELTKTENTYTIHHFNGGWLDESARQNSLMTQKKYHEIEDSAIWVG